MNNHTYYAVINIGKREVNEVTILEKTEYIVKLRYTISGVSKYYGYNALGKNLYRLSYSEYLLKLKRKEDIKNTLKRMIRDAFRLRHGKRLIITPQETLVSLKRYERYKHQIMTALNDDTE